MNSRDPVGSDARVTRLVDNVDERPRPPSAGNGALDRRGQERRVGIHLDRRSPVPLYHQLAVQLERSIRDGALQPGEMLENEVSLARRLELSRPTVRHAVAALVDSGLLRRRRGLGTFVVQDAVLENDWAESLLDGAGSDGRDRRTNVLRLIRGAVDERISTRLKLDPLTPLIVLERLRLINGAPIAILKNWLPMDVPDLSIAALEASGLHDALARRGIVSVACHVVVGSRTPTTEERRLLALDRSDSILSTTQVACSPDGRPIDYAEHIYRADRYQFGVTRYGASPAQPLELTTTSSN